MSADSHKQGVTDTPDSPHQLFELHAPAVARYLARRVGAQDAADLLGDVFVAALDARGRWTPHESGSALPWLYGIAGNLVRVHLRNRAPVSGGPVPEIDAGVDWDAVDDRLDASSQRGHLRAALASLSPSDRELLLLVAWEGLTPTEAGQVLGINAAAARTRLHRARARAQLSLSDLEASHAAR